MTNTEAISINGKTVQAFAAMTIGEAWELPVNTLGELCEAARIVSELGLTTNADGSKTIHCTCDDRLIAAMYALENYGRSIEQLCKALGYEVTA